MNGANVPPLTAPPVFAVRDSRGRQHCLNLPVKSISDYISEIEKKLKQTKVDHTILKTTAPAETH
jgi:hypothetical protein